ncbi:potassium transporter [Clostridioides difficile]
MWYVNFLNGAGIDEKAKCFILTIWYVNTAPKTYNESVTSVFYINYVVCK